MPTISEATVLESRVSKLEQDNRRLILVVIALLLVLTVFLFMLVVQGVRCL